MPNSYLRNPLWIVFAYLLLSILIIGCSKEAPFQIDPSGDFCTHRIGILGDATSSISISKDTSEEFDYIISNISGYGNSSQAYFDIGAYLAGDVLRVPTKEVSVGNANTLVISARGEIASNGFISFVVETEQADNELTYDLLMKPMDLTTQGKYVSGENEIDFGVEKTVFTLNDSDNVKYVFELAQINSAGCEVILEEYNLTNQIDQSTFNLNGVMYTMGNEIKGELKFENNTSGNNTSIVLDLDRNL